MMRGGVRQYMVSWGGTTSAARGGNLRGDVRWPVMALGGTGWYAMARGGVKWFGVAGGGMVRSKDGGD